MIFKQIVNYRQPAQERISPMTTDTTASRTTISPPIWTTTDAQPAPLAAPGHAEQPDARAAALARIVDLACNAVDSPHTARAYRRHLENFLTWYAATDQAGLTRATVQTYRKHLIDTTTASSANQALSAVKLFVTECEANGLITYETARAIRDVRSKKTPGTRQGNWLTEAQLGRLVNQPDCATLKGLRDRAILAVFAGSALRREEVTKLTYSHFQMIKDRWVILNIVGKRGKVRTVGIDFWVMTAVDAYRAALAATGAELDPAAPLFVPMRRGDHPHPEGMQRDHPAMTPQALYYVVIDAARSAGYPQIRPHDLRRSYAKIADDKGANRRQLSLNLGHESDKTTGDYLGNELKYTDMPGDFIHIRLTA